MNKKLRMITVADTHGCFSQSKQEFIDSLELGVDVILLLGDIGFNDLKQITALRNRMEQKPEIIGVLGNHDPKDLYDDFPEIRLLDHRPLYVKGVSFVGLSGSINYKYGKNNYYTMTQKESAQISKQIERANILVTHSNAAKKIWANKTNFPDAHDGLIGITRYIWFKHPSYHLYGHLHEPKEGTYKNKTKYKCCYKVEAISIDVEV